MFKIRTWDNKDNLIDSFHTSAVIIILQNAK